MKWKPIETAPKDGRGIILHCSWPADDPLECKHATMVGHWDDGRFRVVVALGVEDMIFSCGLQMPWTHWAPLPDLPAPPE